VITPHFTAKRAHNEQKQHLKKAHEKQEASIE
jgi:hypothetical protein